MGPGVDEDQISPRAAYVEDRAPDAGAETIGLRASPTGRGPGAPCLHTRWGGFPAPCGSTNILWYREILLENSGRGCRNRAKLSAVDSAGTFLPQHLPGREQREPPPDRHHATPPETGPLAPAPSSSPEQAQPALGCVGTAPRLMPRLRRPQTCPQEARAHSQKHFPWEMGTVCHHARAFSLEDTWLPRLFLVGVKHPDPTPLVSSTERAVVRGGDKSVLEGMNPCMRVTRCGCRRLRGWWPLHISVAPKPPAQASKGQPRLPD